MTSGPLAGITVLELGGFIAGPFCGQLLGDYGARVIKVEPPEGDPIRRWGIQHDGQGLWWPSLARNKESLVLDLHDVRDQDRLAEVCRKVDVVVENFAPGRLAEWGLDYSRLSAANPGLILVHLSGFGQSGPRAADRGFGSVAEAMGGLRYLIGYPDRPPVRTGISLGDALGGLFAANGALAALNERSVSGKGQEVDVALYESVFALTESLLADWEVGGVQRARTGSALPGVAPSNVYTCAGGAEILIAANSDSLFGRLCRAMGMPELSGDPRFSGHQARGQHAEELDQIIQAWCSDRSFEEIEELLDAHHVPRGRIYTAADILVDAQYEARSMVLRSTIGGDPLPVPMPGIVPKFSRTPGSVRSVGPSLGEHTNLVLGELDGADSRRGAASGDVDMSPTPEGGR